jgi:hypothetical protein
MMLPAEMRVLPTRTDATSPRNREYVKTGFASRATPYKNHPCESDKEEPEIISCTANTWTTDSSPSKGFSSSEKLSFMFLSQCNENHKEFQKSWLANYGPCVSSSTWLSKFLLPDKMINTYPAYNARMSC